MTPAPISLEILDRQDFAAGQSFGETGVYEVITGRAHLRILPGNIGADGMYEREHIQTDANGNICAATDIWLLAPKDPARANGTLLFEFVNRGNKRVLQFFNNGRASNRPTSLADAGNGFLMQHGYTVLIAAWQGDVLPGDGRVVLDLPPFAGPPERMTATISAEFIAEGPLATCLPISGKTGTRSYPALEGAPARLTRRRYPHSPAEEIPASQWSFARIEGAGGGLGAGDVQGSEQAIQPSRSHVWLPEGFRPGWIHELTYTATSPLPFDVGFVAVAELVSHLKYNSEVLGIGLNRAIGWGRSQSGRAIRDFLHRGFNRDHAGRQVFDGMLPHISGGGKTNMNRFTNLVVAASREYEDHLFASDLFPFSYAWSRDHLSGVEDAILKRPATDPKVIHTHSAAEYWHRRGSLVHTDTHGNDLEQPESVRVYMWSSSQHWADPVPSIPPLGQCRNLQNVVQTVGFFRGTLLLMDRWLRDGTPPPASRIPRRADGTLVRFEDWTFPDVPGVMLPRRPNRLHAVDYGPGYAAGHAAPPAPVKDLQNEYAVLVPQSDALGNDIAGLRAPMVEAPLASYTGWNVRAPGFGHGMLHGFSGSTLPFPETPEEAALTGDTRPSVLDLYPRPEDYTAAIRAAAARLAEDGFLVDDDVEIAVAQSAGWGRINHPRSL